MKPPTLKAIEEARKALDNVYEALETNELRNFREDPLMVAISDLEFELMKAERAAKEEVGA
jgi:uncharacterized coiled-coil DUF342 family protein